MEGIVIVAVVVIAALTLIVRFIISSHASSRLETIVSPTPRSKPRASSPGSGSSINGVPNTNDSMEPHLIRIEGLLASINSWLTFFGILTIIGLFGYAVLYFINYSPTV